MPFPPIPVPFNPHHPYNASYPYILGNEYVPIKEEVVEFLPEPSVEYGYRFRYEGYEWAQDETGNDTLVGGFPNQLIGVYDLLKQPQFLKQKWALNLYPNGGEYSQGPVRSVTIPVSSFPATGNSGFTASDTFNGRDPSVLFTYHYAAIVGSTLAAADLSFDLTGYRSLLKGKRVLDVSLLYAGAVRDYAPEVTGIGAGIFRQVPVTYDPQYRQYAYEPLTLVAFQKAYVGPQNFIDFDLAYLADNGPRGWGSMPGLIFQSSDDTAVPPDELPIAAISLGNSNKGTATNITTWDDFGEYTYDMLETLHPGYPLTARMVLRMFVQLPNTAAATAGQYPRLIMNYIGLKITYCEESRLAYGEIDFSLLSGSTNVGRAPRPIGNQNTPIDSTLWAFNGTTMVRSSLFTPGALPKGNYTVTVSPQNIGDDAGLRQRFHPVPLNVTRQLYQTPMLDCVQITAPYPVTSSANYDRPFSIAEGTLMPKATLLPRFSGNPRHRYNSHVYSRQIQAPVYSDFKNSQRVVQFSQAITGMTNKQFPHVRFWARHFPGTQVPLRVQQDMDPGLVFTRFATFDEWWQYAPDGPWSASIPTVNDGGTGSASVVKTNVLSPVVTGDMEFRADFTYFDWSQSQTDLFLFSVGQEGVFSYSSLGTTSVALMLNETVTSPIRTVPFMSVVWWDSGGSVHTVPINIPPTFLQDRGRIQVRALFDIDNGAAGHTVNWYMANEITTGWVFIGSVTVAGLAAPRVGGANTRYAIGNAFDSHDPGLIVHSAQFYSGLSSTTLRADVDFQHIATDTTSFTDNVGMPWVINYNSDPESNQGFTPPRIIGAESIPAAIITPNEFDALTPLTTDGWAQVDLVLDPPYATNAFNPYLRWSARGERAGSRWEILGASSWEPSGLIPGQFIAQMPLGTINSGDRGTYTGGTDGLVWIPQLGPYVTGSVVDYRSDISFLLANDPPMVSGFGVSNATQDLAYDANCGLPPCGIPTGLDYLALSWDLGDAAACGGESRFGKLKDTFDRDVSSGWGSPDYGTAYTNLNDLSSSLTYVVQGEGGFIATSSAASGFVGLLSESGNGPNFDMTFFVRQLTDLVRLETVTAVRAYGRYIDSNNYYWIDVAVAPQLTGGVVSVDDAIDSGVVLYFGKKVAGTETVIDSRQLWAVPAGYAAETGFNVRWMCSGSIIKVKVWEAARDEPLLWNMEWEDVSITDDVQGGLSLNFVSPASSGFFGVWSAYSLDATSFGVTGTTGLMANLTLPGPASALVSGVLATPLSFGSSLIPAEFSCSMNILSVGTSDIRLEANWKGSDGTYRTARSTLNLLQIVSPGTRISLRAEIDTSFQVARFYYSYGTDLANTDWIAMHSSIAVTGSWNVASTAGPAFIGQSLPDGWIVHSVRRDRGSTPIVMVHADFDCLPADTTSFVDDTGYTWFLPYGGLLYGQRYADGVGFAAKHSEGRAIWKFEDIEITPPRYWFGYHEIQREDDDEPGDWQSIMQATNPAITEFNDYEARPGIATRYRIRTVDKYGFEGPWSPEISGMVPAPGAQGDCLTNAHLLLLTSNEVQDGSSNLAYSSVWEDGTVTEDFTFPDANVVQMQAMYDRDFYVAFRPLERAGEQFTRNVLVQAAAVDPARLGNFTSLRNLSWEDLNYVCVRDEDGNRWLSSISIPSGTVKRRRTLYLAPIQITEVTDTPTPVDPEWQP